MEAPMSVISSRGAYIGALILLASQPARLSATTLLPGFTEVVVVSGLNQPTSFVFLPDGRMLISEKGGTIRVFKNNVLLATPAITLAVSSDGERGGF
jgi:glucose/arabinose dehydrogenase